MVGLERPGHLACHHRVHAPDRSWALGHSTHFTRFDPANSASREGNPGRSAKSKVVDAQNRLIERVGAEQDDVLCTIQLVEGDDARLFDQLVDLLVEGMFLDLRRATLCGDRDRLAKICRRSPISAATSACSAPPDDAQRLNSEPALRTRFGSQARGWRDGPRTSLTQPVRRAPTHRGTSVSHRHSRERDAVRSPRSC